MGYTSSSFPELTIDCTASDSCEVCGCTKQQLNLTFVGRGMDNSVDYIAEAHLLLGEFCNV